MPRHSCPAPLRRTPPPATQSFPCPIRLLRRPCLSPPCRKRPQQYSRINGHKFQDVGSRHSCPAPLRRTPSPGDTKLSLSHPVVAPPLPFAALSKAPAAIQPHQWAQISRCWAIAASLLLCPATTRPFPATIPELCSYSWSSVCGAHETYPPAQNAERPAVARTGRPLSLDMAPLCHAGALYGVFACQSPFLSALLRRWKPPPAQRRSGTGDARIYTPCEENEKAASLQAKRPLCPKQARAVCGYCIAATHVSARMRISRYSPAQATASAAVNTMGVSI